VEANETLGQRIRRIRKDRGLSLARITGDDFSRAFLNQVELGKARPSIRVLRIIAERLGTEVEYLLDGRQAGVERELALEKGRVLLAQGEPRRALLALRLAAQSFDWPLGCDARLAQAQAYIALGRRKEADRILAHERNEIELHNDRHRMERLKTIERGGAYRFTGDAVRAHLQMADRSARHANDHDALEHYRAARVLYEAGLDAGSAPPPTESETADIASADAVDPEV
jgi:transcriptional regulator with XRE-family HTH domain